jgi:hypothetical protein
MKKKMSYDKVTSSMKGAEGGIIARRDERDAVE